MAEIFDTARPIYSQLVERLTQKIVSGIYMPGERLPSVRDMSQAVGVNPNTMQRALAELERKELLYTERTAGRFVTKNTELIQKMREELFASKIADFTKEMLSLGCDIGWLTQQVESIAKNQQNISSKQKEEE